jgi:hypothetical protein
MIVLLKRFDKTIITEILAIIKGIIMGAVTFDLLPPFRSMEDYVAIFTPLKSGVFIENRNG